ncbi:MAG TPA: hypothetical protein VH307_20550 [Streptosporangiaceae bacterium]|nr:hypothetical protein [Streptosporangiaceae bacterium]
MNTLEDRLRDAYGAVAGTIDPATVLSLAVSTQPPATSFRWIRFVAPLAAAAAVTMVVTLTTLAVGTSPRHHARTARTRPTAAASRPAAASLPAFTLVDLGSSVKVYDTRTGHGVATLTAPAGQQFEDVASGGAARTFLVATGLSGSACHAYFYRFQLSATGQPSKLTFLRSVPGSQPTAVAGAAGGGTYAYSTVHCHTAPPNGGIGISGQAGNRTWEYPVGDDYAFSLAPTADGRTLALSLFVGYGPGQQDVLLNTQSTSPTVAGASRILPAVPFSQTLAISPDGQTLYACASDGSTGTLAAYSTTTGALIRVLHQWPGLTGFTCQVSADPTGRFLLAAVTPDVNKPWTLIGFDLQTNASATVPIHPDLPFQGTQLAW